MTRAILLDTGPLGLLTSPPGRKGNAAVCARWLRSLLAAGARVVVPEIADYELRRAERAGLVVDGVACVADVAPKSGHEKADDQAEHEPHRRQ